MTVCVQIYIKVTYDEFNQLFIDLAHGRKERHLRVCICVFITFDTTFVLEKEIKKCLEKLVIVMYVIPVKPSWST